MLTTELGQRRCPRNVLFPLHSPSKSRANSDTVPLLDHFSHSLHLQLWAYPIIHLHQALDRGFLIGALWLRWGYPWTYRHTFYSVIQGGSLGIRHPGPGPSFSDDFLHVLGFQYLSLDLSFTTYIKAQQTTAWRSDPAPHLFLHIKFYWNTAACFHLLTNCLWLPTQSIC